MTENVTHGSMRGGWKPGMVFGIEALPERDKGAPPGAWSHGASFLLYRLTLGPWFRLQNPHPLLRVVECVV